MASVGMGGAPSVRLAELSNAEAGPTACGVGGGRGRGRRHGFDDPTAAASTAAGGHKDTRGQHKHETFHDNDSLLKHG